MKWYLVLLSLLLVALAVADDEEVEELELAVPCNEESCKLPSCRCSSTAIPGGLAPRNTPQFVVVTFDDSVNVLNMVTYRELLIGRRNSNQCPAGATFYVNHEYTNYQLVNELYNNGFEIALHSMTHQTPQTYWAVANKETIEREFSDQRIQMSHFANIPLTAIQGMRMPFLQLAGNASFEILKDNNMLYDASWPTMSFVDPGLWPYTLDYASIQDCPIPPCPTASIPGPWVLPMIAWRDLLGFPCAMVDACFAPPDMNDENAWFQFISQNFERHYKGNRAPFGFYAHEWLVRTNPAVFRAVARFLNVINNLNDVFMVNAKDVIDWMKSPVPINEYINQPCKQNVPSNCSPSLCGPLEAPHTQEQFWMQICNVCPRVYPWRGNPFGL
ncbi:unnamed protein product [Diatraea saccharalis]|uniref:NodB homology domain-containing protein n=1 Tax=Diatraea saccharalis TaxID=40085 RepID=A0A9N9R9P1_9NEOP|nr:unnamed protein product [Diatraea saccharalis]